MRTTTDLKDTILQKAGDLFAEQGYTATSNKQIAKAAACTTAALYYYFEGGKAQILREVIHLYSRDLDHVFKAGKDVENLSELLIVLGRSIAQAMPEILRRISWLQPEFPHLSDAEKAEVQNLFVSLHRGITTLLARFIEDEEALNRLSWLVLCAYFGYEQVFLKMEVNRLVPFDIEAFTKTLANVVNERTS
ncbi:MAG: TetR/AcrR family transcriptional regulator [Ktedonobacteraceae bacterium]|nr:TetR/AcrR family transcriptional regulator [Ktedonobacteraceae bacterium]